MSNLQISKESSVFYTNALDKSNRPKPIKNSILEDQFEAFGANKNHYLKKSYLIVDSSSRNKQDVINSVQLDIEKMGVLMNSNRAGQIYLYIPKLKLDNSSFIYFTNISTLTAQINGINTRNFEFNPITNTPIFNANRVDNLTMYNIFGWATLNEFISAQYLTKEELIADLTTINFYSFFYTSNPNVKLNNYAALFIKTKPNLFQVVSRQMGYPQSSYFKIFLANSFSNIYKIVLFNVSLPKNIFNINNDAYTINNYKYLVNSKLRFMLYSDQFLISNIDYVGARVKYDFLNSEAIYDINGYNKIDYKFRTGAFQPKYPHFYLANDIYQLMMRNLNIITSINDFFNYTNNNIFEVAYFFLQQFHLHYNTDVFSIKDNSHYPFGLSTAQKNPNETNRLFYIYSSDFVADFNQLSNFILRDDDTLMIKNPLVYFNDYLLYVNNETFVFYVSVGNWMDQIIKVRNDSDYSNDFGFCKLYGIINNVNEQLIGTIQDVNVSSKKRPVIKGQPSNGVDKKIYYNIGIFIVIPNFDVSSIIGIPIYATYTSNSFNYVENTVNSYIGINTENSTYNYRIYLDFVFNFYTALNTNIFQYKSNIYRKITTALINSNILPLNLKLVHYILILGNCPTGFVGNSINGSIIYSKINDQNTFYIPNTVLDFIGEITFESKTCFAYKMYVFDQNSFTKTSSIYTLSNQNQYNLIGNAIEIFDVYYNQQIDESIQGFVPGNWYNSTILVNNAILLKKNYFLKDLGNRTYLVGYSSVNFAKIYTNMISQGEILYDYQNNVQIGIAEDGYQLIGTLDDVQFELLLDASLYLTEAANYNITTTENSQLDQDIAFQNKKETPVSQTYAIKLDNIRIIETVTHLNYNVIEYKNKTLILDNNQGVSFATTILEQPFLDKSIKMFIFKLSLKTPGINIGTIYTSTQFVASIDNNKIGTGYSIYYAPIEYTLLVEKSDDFHINKTKNWIEYLFIKYPASKFIKTINFKNKNYISQLPEKTNATGIKNYNMLPVYEINLENGIYTNNSFVSAIENKLNKTSFLEFNYFKKSLDVINLNKKKLNEPNYQQPRFKINYDDTTKNININSYSIKNCLIYQAIYNPINPYLYFKVRNGKFENNKILFIEVIKDLTNNKLTNEISSNLNKEFTTRILPIFEYQVRIISPVPDLQYIKTVQEKDRIIPNNIYDILSQISLLPFQFRSRYPESHEKMRYVGQTLKNIFGNNNSYAGSGKIVFNSGVPCGLMEDELVMVINNLYYSYEDYKIGRIVRITDKTSNEKGNYGMRIQMSGETNVSNPIFIGDIIYGLTSKVIACIVPYEWGSLTEFPKLAELHSGLPTEDIIRYGYKNYLKLLYNFTQRQYLLEYINNYSMESFLYDDSYRQVDYFFDRDKINNTTNPLNHWPIQEVKNCYVGFEVRFEYSTSFHLTQDDLSLYFLSQNQYCLFIGKNASNEYDSPKNIMGFNSNNILDINDFTVKGSSIPWNTSFNNNNNFNQQSIQKMYLTYGSDNVIQQNIYLQVDDTAGYQKGDTIYINDMNVRTDLQRNIFNIYNTVSYNVQRMFSFDMYLTFIALRLAFIKSGVPIAMGPNDYLGLLNLKQEIPLSNGSSYSTYMMQYYATRIPNSLFIPANNELIAFIDIIYNNFKLDIDSNRFNGMNENITGDLGGGPPISSTNIAETYAYIINKILIGDGSILSWFVQPDNFLLWTKGDRANYLHLQETYMDIQYKNIWRFELEILDDFIFKDNINIRDKNGVLMGRVSKNNLYKDSSPINNSFYTLYILVATGYNNILESNSTTALDYIYTDDMAVSNRIKTVPILITNDNKYIYLYDTYLKFKTILQLAPDNSDNVQKCLNFNNIDSINSLLMNLYNLENQNNICFKNGYFMNIARNEIFPETETSNDFNLDGQYRIMVNLLDNKTIMHMCLTQLNLIDSYDSIKNNIINMQVNNLKKITQIRALLDIFQLLVDLSTINSAMIDLDFTQLIENNIHKAFENQARLIDNLYSICGSRNFYLEDISYKPEFIYGTTANPSGEVVSYLNFYFQQIYSDAEVASYKLSNTVETNMCNLDNIYSKNEYGSDINSNIVIFNAPSPFVYGVVWVPADPGDKLLYVIVPAYDVIANKSVYIMNKNDLSNYLITINFVYIDQQKSIDLNTIERNETIQSNIIESISIVNDSFESSEYNQIPHYETDSSGNINSSLLTTYRIFKINLKYELKYNVIRGMLIQIKDYATTIYKPNDFILKNTNTIMVLQNWNNEKQFLLKSGFTICINYGSYNSIYKKYINEYNNLSDKISLGQDNDHNIYEETNLITGVSPSMKIIGGKKYWELTLLNPLKYEYTSGLPIIFRFNPTNNSSFYPCISEYSTPHDVPYESISDTIVNNNDILTNGLATQSFISNDEWYTKIFYQSEKNIDLYDLNPCGVKTLNNLSKRKINISGMKGYVVPNIGFQSIERNYYNSNEINLEDSQMNSYIKPVPDGAYDLAQIQKEHDLNILNHTNDITIPGYYKPIYNDNSPEQSDEWIDNFNNVRWFYAVEDTNNNISTLKNVDLYQLNPPDNTTHQEPETLFNKLCYLISVVPTNTFFNNKNVYKVYVMLNIKNLVSLFLATKYNMITQFSQNYNDILYNTILTTRDQSHKIKIIYYGFRESVDYDYANTFKRYNYYSITIKGRYQGYGGNIIFETPNSVFNSIPYTVSKIKTEYNTIELNMQTNYNLFLSFFRFNTTGYRQNIDKIYKKNYNKNAIKTTQNNPAFTGFNQTPMQYDNAYTNANQIIEYYDIYPSKFGFLANNGYIFKKTINQPLTTRTNDFFYLCIKNLESDVHVGQNNVIGNYVIFAKVYQDNDENSNSFYKFKSYDLIFDQQLKSKIDELEVFLLDKLGNLINLNNLDYNIEIEIHEYIEKIKNIDTKNGMVF